LEKRRELTIRGDTGSELDPCGGLDAPLADRLLRVKEDLSLVINLVHASHDHRQYLARNDPFEDVAEPDTLVIARAMCYLR